MHLTNKFSSVKSLVVMGALIASTLFGVFLSIPHAHAQTTCKDGETYVSLGEAGGQCVTNENLKKSGLDKVKSVAKITPDQERNFCNSASTCISGIVYIFTAGLMSIFAYIGGYVFDFAVQMALNSVSYSLDFLTSGWTIVRDLANMAFIFILIYIAFSIILRAETAGTMKTLAGVVIMALLVNFSFFLTRLAIDSGNILAIQFYNSIEAPTLAQTAGGTGLINASAGVANYFSRNKETKDLTAGIMQAVQVQNILNTDSFKKFSSDNNFLVNVITQSLVYIAVGMMLAVLAVTFLTVGFKFLMRLVILWFVIISAPLAFAARALSNNAQAKGLYAEWQSLLIKFSFYPAIFLFLFLIISTVVRNIAGCIPLADGTCQPGSGLVPSVFSDLNNLGAGAGNSAFLALGAAIANVGIRIGLVVIMLYYGLRVADYLVERGSEAAEKFAGAVGRRTGDIIYGGMGLAGRNTFGRLGYKAADASTRAANNSSGISRSLLKGGAWVGNKLGKGSYDMRGIRGYRGGASLDALKPSDRWFDGLNIGEPGRGLKKPKQPQPGNKAPTATQQPQTPQPQGALQKPPALAQLPKPTGTAVALRQAPTGANASFKKIPDLRAAKDNKGKGFSDAAQQLKEQMQKNRGLDPRIITVGSEAGGASASDKKGKGFSTLAQQLRIQMKENGGTDPKQRLLGETAASVPQQTTASAPNPAPVQVNVTQTPAATQPRVESSAIDMVKRPDGTWSMPEKANEEQVQLLRQQSKENQRLMSLVREVRETSDKTGKGFSEFAKQMKSQMKAGGGADARVMAPESHIEEKLDKIDHSISRNITLNRELSEKIDSVPPGTHTPPIADPKEVHEFGEALGKTRGPEEKR